MNYFLFLREPFRGTITIPVGTCLRFSIFDIFWQRTIRQLSKCEKIWFVLCRLAFQSKIDLLCLHAIIVSLIRHLMYVKNWIELGWTGLNTLGHWVGTWSLISRVTLSTTSSLHTRSGLALSRFDSSNSLQKKKKPNESRHSGFVINTENICEATKTTNILLSHPNLSQR